MISVEGFVEEYGIEKLKGKVIKSAPEQKHVNHRIVYVDEDLLELDNGQIVIRCIWERYGIPESSLHPEPTRA